MCLCCLLVLDYMHLYRSIYPRGIPLERLPTIFYQQTLSSSLIFTWKLIPHVKRHTLFFHEYMFCMQYLRYFSMESCFIWDLLNFRFLNFSFLQGGAYCIYFILKLQILFIAISVGAICNFQY